MRDTVFLIDTNALITPYQQYYPFDFAKSFWDQLQQHIENGDIAILDMVREELLKGYEDDKLRKWIEETKIKEFINHRENDILEQYGKVLQYVQECGFYNDTALSMWSQITVADPWLIAVSMAKGYKLVTFETNLHSLDSGSKTRRVRIPDVANHFNVEIVKLFDMMRDLEFHL